MEQIEMQKQIKTHNDIISHQCPKKMKEKTNNGSAYEDKKH